jgi:mono/diheme cytochrome c family protein
MTKPVAPSSLPSTCRARSGPPASHVLLATLVAAFAVGCGGGGSPTAPTSGGAPGGAASGGTATSPPASVTVSYLQDTKAIFDSDCVVCHGPRIENAGVNLTSYQNVLRVVRPGDANSLLVQVTQLGGKMHTNISGDRLTKAALIRRWVVENNAAESR